MHGTYILFLRSLKGILLTIMFIFKYFKAISMTLYIDDFILAFNDFILFDRNKGQSFKIMDLGEI